MAHFAQMNNNKVLQVIAVNNKVLENKEFPESEPIGIAFCKSLFGEDTDWLQTSFSASFREIFAGTGDLYDPELNVFKENVIPTPPDSGLWVWNEETQQLEEKK